MKPRNAIWISAVVMITALCLSACRPIQVYLEQVYKVYGTVTVHGSDPPIPISSVEVFVDEYQYSELTNINGDYEIEIAEGSWTMSFHHDGYLPYSAVVAVGPSEPRVRLDAELVVSEQPAPTTATGLWIFYFTFEDGETASVPIYLSQDGTTVTGTYGTSGHLVESEITLYLEFAEATVSGPFTGNEVIGTWVEDGAASGPWRMERVDPSLLGSFQIEGREDSQDIDVLTQDQALGIRQPVYTANIVSVDVDHPWVESFDLRCWNGDFELGEHDAEGFFHQGWKEDGLYELVSFGTGADKPATGEWLLTITEYEPGVRIAATAVDANGSGYTQAFDLNIGGTGTLTVSGGQDYENGTYTCSSIQQHLEDWNRVGVLYRSVDTDIVLFLSNGRNLGAPMTVTNFRDFENLNLGTYLMFGSEIEDAPFYDYPEAQAGTLQLDRFDETGMTGSFDLDILSEEGGTSGHVSGSFDVTFVDVDQT
jgi:hypothetical protein